jgi:hypothetical protein
MMKRMAVLALAVCMMIPAFAQEATKASARPVAVDKAYLQKIWDGWATLDAAGQKRYYAQGPHVFFDFTPLKYGSWDEYQSTVSKELADYKPPASRSTTTRRFTKVVMLTGSRPRWRRT